jgi:hypothetical protein
MNADAFARLSVTFALFGATAHAQSVELIQNGSFEQGLAGWSSYYVELMTGACAKDPF